MVTTRWPARRLAPIAVRPILASATAILAADSRRSTSVPARPSSVIGPVDHSCRLAVSSLDGRNVGREIERVGGERALQGLAAVGGESEHAFRGVAVKLDIDAGERDGAAHHIGARLEREMREAAARQRLLPEPGQRLAQRFGIGGEHALDLEGRIEADRAFEGALDRRAGEPKLDAAAVAGERSGEIGEREARVHRLAVPDEVAGGAEALGDRRPGERQLDVLQRFAELVRGVAQHHHAAGDAHFGECGKSLYVLLLAARQRRQQRRPIGAAFGIDLDRDSRPLKRHVGDLDPADQQREEPQMRGQPLGRESRLVGVAQHHVVETHPPGRKQRYRRRPAQHRIEAGDRTQLVQHLGAHPLGGYQGIGRKIENAPGRDGGGESISEALEAKGGRQRVNIRVLRSDVSAKVLYHRPFSRQPCAASVTLS